MIMSAVTSSSPVTSSPPSESIAPSPKVSMNPIADHNLTEILPIIDSKGQIVADLLSTTDESSFNLSKYHIRKIPKSKSAPKFPEDLKQMLSLSD